jgi:hypothetical protein
VRCLSNTSFLSSFPKRLQLAHISSQGYSCSQKLTNPITGSLLFCLSNMEVVCFLSSCLVYTHAVANAGLKMSSKLALKQLSSLQESQERPNGTQEIRKAIRKKRRSHKKQATKQQQQAAKQQSSSKLECYKATTTTQKATADIMRKVSSNLMGICAVFPAVVRPASNVAIATVVGGCVALSPAVARAACATRRVRQRLGLGLWLLISFSSLSTHST